MCLFVLNAGSFGDPGTSQIKFWEVKMTNTRNDYYRLHNGEKAALAFSPSEYEARLAGLRAIMARAGVGAAVLTSMHNIAYYSGFLYCSFGRPMRWWSRLTQT